MKTIRQCLKCGRDLTGKRPQAKFCCRLCRIEYHSYLWRKNNPEKARKAMAEADAKYRLKKKQERVKYLLEHPVVCVHCGKMFVASRRSHVKYCSGKCQAKDWVRQHPERVKDRKRRYHRLHAKEYRALGHFRYLERLEKMESDPVLYAKHRAYLRKWAASYRRRKGIVSGEYRAMPSRRIPDYLCKNEEVMDTTSVLIANNLTDEQLLVNMAFSRELSNDRFGKRDRFGKIR